MQPINPENVHIEPDDDGTEEVFDYPPELIDALPKLQAEHGKLWTHLIAPDPGIVVFRKANSIEFRNVFAAQQGDTPIAYATECAKLGHNAIVWPAPTVVQAIAEECPGVPISVGRRAYVQAQGVRETRGKKRPSSPKKG